MKMKKLTSVLLVAACALSLVACGGSGDKKDSSKGGSSSKTAKVIDIDLTNEEYAFGVDKTQPELLEKTNAFIEKIKGVTNILEAESQKQLNLQNSTAPKISL